VNVHLQLYQLLDMIFWKRR